MKLKKFTDVAPLAGAWIEIMSSNRVSLSILSLPSRERGLKLEYTNTLNAEYLSLPSRERGLKLINLGFKYEESNGRSPRGSVD